MLHVTYYVLPCKNDLLFDTKEHLCQPEVTACRYYPQGGGSKTRLRSLELPYSFQQRAPACPGRTAALDSAGNLYVSEDNSHVFAPLINRHLY
jgi:hypothetical protein